MYNKDPFNLLHSWLSVQFCNQWRKRPVWEQLNYNNKKKTFLKVIENTNVIWQVILLVDLWASKNLRPDNNSILNKLLTGSNAEPSQQEMLQPDLFPVIKTNVHLWLCICIIAEDYYITDIQIFGLVSILFLFFYIRLPFQFLLDCIIQCHNTCVWNQVQGLLFLITYQIRLLS